MTKTELDALNSKIIGAAIEVHKVVGPGLLESAYEMALMFELKLRGLKAKNQVPIPFIYKGIVMETGYRADIVVEDEIIVELKAVKDDSPVFEKQLTTYLKLSNKRLGLLINFNKSKLITGITRVVNGI